MLTMWQALGFVGFGLAFGVLVMALVAWDAYNRGFIEGTEKTMRLYEGEGE